MPPDGSHSHAGPYFFVVGFPRSGTTLMSVLLDRHSRLCVSPETAFYYEVAPALRWPWRSEARLSRILGRWRRLGELKLEPAAVCKRVRGSRWTPTDVFRTILDLYAMRSGKARCGEKTPQHLAHVPKLIEDFPGSKVICMLRDGRDAALSLSDMPWWQPGSVKVAARVWRKSLRLQEKFAARYAGAFRVVHYENLVVNPEAQLREIMAFIGEEFEPAQLLPSTPSDVVLDRSLPWKGKALQSIDAASLGSRRRTATPADLAYLERVLKDDLRRMGYSS